MAYVGHYVDFSFLDAIDGLCLLSSTSLIDIQLDPTNRKFCDFAIIHVAGLLYAFLSSGEIIYCDLLTASSMNSVKIQSSSIYLNYPFKVFYFMNNTYLVLFQGQLFLFDTLQQSVFSYSSSLSISRSSELAGISTMCICNDHLFVVYQ